METMKLTEFDNNTVTNASRALKEHYELPFNVNGMNMPATTKMLNKVRGLIKESKQSSDFYKSQATPAYMKLVFMEQALASRFSYLQSLPQTRIVVENEEVEKSQVVLAAQDLVDSVQKMLEEVGQMQVKELPALVSSIESEIGVAESQQYDQQVSQALDSLSASLKEAFGSMKEALGVVTGQGGGMEFDDGMADMGAGLGDMEAGAEDMEAGLGDMEAGAEDMAELPPEEPEIEPVGGVGRAKR
jgi:hypothetical protein